MNREDVISMAREAGIEFHERKNHLRIGTDILFGDDSTEKLERFAALVAAAEREACASACDALVDTKEAARIERRVNDVLENGDEEDQLQAMRHQLTVSTFNAGIKGCAAAIRARSFA